MKKFDWKALLITLAKVVVGALAGWFGNGAM